MMDFHENLESFPRPAMDVAVLVNPEHSVDRVLMGLRRIGRRIRVGATSNCIAGRSQRARRVAGGSARAVPLPSLTIDINLTVAPIRKHLLGRPPGCDEFVFMPTNPTCHLPVHPGNATCSEEKKNENKDNLPGDFHGNHLLQGVHCTPKQVICQAKKGYGVHLMRYRRNLELSA